MASGGHETRVVVRMPNVRQKVNLSYVQDRDEPEDLDQALCCRGGSWCSFGTRHIELWPTKPSAWYALRGAYFQSNRDDILGFRPIIRKHNK